MKCAWWQRRTELLWRLSPQYQQVNIWCVSGAESDGGWIDTVREAAAWLIALCFCSITRASCSHYAVCYYSSWHSRGFQSWGKASEAEHDLWPQQRHSFTQMSRVWEAQEQKFIRSTSKSESERNQESTIDESFHTCPNTPAERLYKLVKSIRIKLFIGFSSSFFMNPKLHFQSEYNILI